MHMPCNCQRNNRERDARTERRYNKTKKERNLVKVLPLQGYAQQEVHPCRLDNKARRIVALRRRLQSLNMLYTH
jgi:hypothetical protein